MINTTHAKQETDIIQRILEQSDYSESLDNVQLSLSQFEGKHFRHLSHEQLLTKVKHVSTKIKRNGLINHFMVSDKNTNQENRVIFDVLDKIQLLKEYKQKLEKLIANEELQSRLKKNNYCRLDETSKVFYFMFPNGSIQSMPLWTERAKSNDIFILFKTLFDHWLESGEQVMPLTLMKQKLTVSGWIGVSNENISGSMSNIRRAKIAAAGLSRFVEISFDKSEAGYKMKIVYP